MVARSNRYLAQIANEKFYYSEKPCKLGHFEKRVTATGTCTACRKLKARERYPIQYVKNKGKILIKNEMNRQRRLEADLAYKREYYQSNKEKVLEYQKRYREENRDKDRAWKRNYKERKTRRTPNWLTPEQLMEITGFYTEAQRLTEITGVQHHVDHIVPLRGKIVSGLHVPWNLQILTFIENRTKSNKFEQEGVF